eukprot:TRINITY_DN5874_c0_g1_i2.p1 TRINITY_DN5874_c0_g1~~TRINITY_DN5874_c0_g1_i2.p1  ORF type:complete len:1026 (+),score=319.15 TRINITY_DN5874_c0_g1_i2:56-3133(+)
MSYERCLAALEKAVGADERGDAAAVAAYSDAVEAIMQWMGKEPRADRRQKLQRHAEECLARGEMLKREGRRRSAVQRAADAAVQAAALTTAGKHGGARRQYLDAAQVLIDYTKGADGKSDEKNALALLNAQIGKYLNQAETAAVVAEMPAVPQHKMPAAPLAAPPLPGVDAGTTLTLTPMDDSGKRGGPATSPKGGYQKATAQQYNKLSPAEEAFLKQRACVVYGSKLPLWDDEKEGYPAYHGVLHNQRPKALFTDARPPQFSPRQKEHGVLWMRPKEFLPPNTPPRVCTDPINPLDVVQSVVGNCSYVCSLTVAAHYERRFPTKRVITAAIFPQDARGRPVVSASGLYAVKLLINGAVRVVVIDDRIPVAKGVAWVGGPAGGHSVATAGHSPLCGHSASGDLWVSLYEKAFLKVFGASYDFGGSSSSADLYHLCGWIPETLELSKDKTDKDAEWARLHSAHHKGLIMVTVATPSKQEMPEEWREKLGLIAGHAYSVLDFAEYTGGGAKPVRLMKIMNPWRSQRWMGRYSHQDNKSWTADLVKHFRYDRSAEDKGIFWIEWNDAVTFFDRLHISWNPHTFGYKFALHADVPKQISENNHYFRCRQYVLSVLSPSKSALWVLLNRHLPPTNAPPGTPADDVDPFITLHVYNTTYLPGVKALRIGQSHAIGKPRCIENGVYRNSAHRLVKIKVPAAAHPQHFHVVVSALKPCALPHSLYLFSPLKDVSLAAVPAHPYEHTKSLKGTWAKTLPNRPGGAATSAGGRLGAKHWRFNPQFRFEVREPCHVFATLEMAKEANVGMSISRTPEDVLKAQHGKPWLGRVYSIQSVCHKSGSYGQSFASINTVIPPPEADDAAPLPDFALPPQVQAPPPLSPGIYTVVPCTYDAGFEANFKLTLYAPVPSVAASFAEVLPEGAGMHHKQLTGTWQTPPAANERRRSVTFHLFNYREITARVTVNGDAIVTAAAVLDSVPAVPQGVCEYLIPVHRPARAPTASAPAVLTVSVPAAQTATFVVDCYTDAALQVASR